MFARRRYVSSIIFCWFTLDEVYVLWPVGYALVVHTTKTLLVSIHYASNIEFNDGWRFRMLCNSFWCILQTIKNPGQHGGTFWLGSMIGLIRLEAPFRFDSFHPIEFRLVHFHSKYVLVVLSLGLRLSRCSDWHFYFGGLIHFIFYDWLQPQILSRTHIQPSKARGGGFGTVSARQL